MSWQPLSRRNSWKTCSGRWGRSSRLLIRLSRVTIVRSEYLHCSNTFPYSLIKNFRQKLLSAGKRKWQTGLMSFRSTWTILNLKYKSRTLNSKMKSSKQIKKLKERTPSCRQDWLLKMVRTSSSSFKGLLSTMISRTSIRGQYLRSPSSRTRLSTFKRVWTRIARSFGALMRTYLKRQRGYR